MTRRRSTYPGDAAIDWSRKFQGAAAGFASGSVIGSESPPGGGLPLPVCLLVRSLVGSLLVGCCRLCLSLCCGVCQSHAIEPRPCPCRAVHPSLSLCSDFRSGGDGPPHEAAGAAGGPARGHVHGHRPGDRGRHPDQLAALAVVDWEAIGAGARRWRVNS